MYPSIDHGLLSPSGKMSKRARNAAMERELVKLFGDGLAFPAGPVQTVESERQKDLQYAAQLRALAAGGMRPRVHIREAARLESKWA